MFLIKNTYNLLSVFFVIWLVVTILYKDDILLLLSTKKDKVIEKVELPAQEEEVVNEVIDEIEEVINEIVEEKELMKIKDIYEFDKYLNIWYDWEDVEKLQELLGLMWYYNLNITWNYDEVTKLSVKAMLQKECDWPTTTLWIFWPQAMECFNNLQIEYGIKSN